MLGHFLCPTKLCRLVSMTLDSGAVDRRRGWLSTSMSRNMFSVIRIDMTWSLSQEPIHIQVGDPTMLQAFGEVLVSDQKPGPGAHGF